MPQTLPARLFWLVTAKPLCTLLAVLLPLLATTLGLGQLQKDTRAEAFLPAGHPAVAYRDRVKETFGLKDPMLIAVINRGPQGVFNPQSLNLVTWLSERVADMPGVDPNRVMSLSTEKSFTSAPDGLLIKPFIEGPIDDQAAAAAVRAAVMDMPLYVGSLVSESGEGTLIAIELADPDVAEQLYHQLEALAAEAPVGAGDELRVAGEGALMGYLGTYIDRDANRLTPIALLIVLALLFLSHRTALGVALPVFVALLTLGSVLGAMAWLGRPFYFITNGLPVILLAISVADALHILGQYYFELARAPDRPKRETVVQSMLVMWRPVGITSVTTIAGFLAVYVASSSPPMKDFGAFAALGVAVALIVSLTAVPALLVLLPAKLPRAFAGLEGSGELPRDGVGTVLRVAGGGILRRPSAVLLMSLAVVLAGIVGLLRLEANDSDLDNFQETEPIRVAHSAINETFDGAHNLDIVIETRETEALFDPERLQHIEALQAYAESLPHVTASRSIVDYLKQLNRVLFDGETEAYRLPESEEAVAQYFLLYSMSGDPADFEEEVDYDYRLANIRVTLDSGEFQDERQVVVALERYIDSQFNRPDMTAKVSGRAAVHYHWMVELLEGHFLSVALALAVVGLTAILAFRSPLYGILALLPVALSVLLIYAVMGLSGIWLGIGTSMSAAIAIGVGVRLRRSCHRSNQSAAGRSSSAAGRGSGGCLPADRPRVVVQLPDHLLRLRPADDQRDTGPDPLRQSGRRSRGQQLPGEPCAPAGAYPVVDAGCFGSRDGALRGGDSRRAQPSHRLNEDRRAMFKTQLCRAALPGVLLVFSAAAFAAQGTGDLPSGDEIARLINARDDGQSVSRKIVMELTEKSGKSRVRTTRSYRKNFGDERRIAIFYDKPRNLEGTAFLTYDYPQAGVDDDQWLYLPALRKSRRVSGSERGDYFMGTDFSYDDMKQETKVSLDEYSRNTLGMEEVDGRQLYKVEATPVSAEVAEELGYGRVITWVDPEIWMARKSEFWDTRGKLLKTLRFREISQINGIWTPHILEVVNHQSGHRTLFTISEVDYNSEVSDRLFRRESLGRGS